MPGRDRAELKLPHSPRIRRPPGRDPPEAMASGTTETKTEETNTEKEKTNDKQKYEEEHIIIL